MSFLKCYLENETKGALKFVNLTKKCEYSSLDSTSTEKISSEAHMSTSNYIILNIWVLPFLCYFVAINL